MKAHSDIPPLDRRLPRGRHALDPEVVFDHQRRRLLQGAADAVAERGLLSVTVADIIARAGVSRGTFYRHFDDKAHCLAAAYDDAFDELSAAIRSACAAQPRWPDNVAAAIEAAAEFAVRSPSRATLAAVPPKGCEPALLARVLEARRDLTTMLSTAAVQGGRSGPVHDLAAEAMVAGVVYVISTRLEPSAVHELRRLAPQLAELILAPFEGAASEGGGAAVEGNR